MDLRLLDINVWHGLYARSIWRVDRLEQDDAREKRTLALIEGIKELDPDVVTIQESFPQPSFVRRIAEAIGHDHVSVVSNAGIRLLGTGYPFGGGTGEGSSILARKGLGLKLVAERSLSGAGFTSEHFSLQVLPRRMALAAELKAGAKRVVVATAHIHYEYEHLDGFRAAWDALHTVGRVEKEPPASVVKSVESTMKKRDRELVVFAEWLEHLGKDGDAVLVGADLNVDETAPQLMRYGGTGARFSDVLVQADDRRRTWDPARNPHIALSSRYDHEDGTKKELYSLLSAHHDRIPQRPDHVLIGQNPGPDALRDARVVLETPRGGTFASDHFGILAVVRI